MTLFIVRRFYGNVILRDSPRGVAKMLVGDQKNVHSGPEKQAGLSAGKGRHEGILREKLDAETNYGGALMMGVTKPVIKAHGSSNAKRRSKRRPAKTKAVRGKRRGGEHARKAGRRG